MQRLEIAKQRVPLICATLEKNGSMTVSEISERTAITAASVRHALALMLSDGDVETQIRPRRGSGRNPTTYRLTLKKIGPRFVQRHHEFLDVARRLGTLAGRFGIEMTSDVVLHILAAIEEIQKKSRTATAEQPTV